MQELRFVAVSEDGSYAVLAVPGRSGRYVLPIDERLRAIANGHTSRLAQYEIEVESPLRPKEIQARIRAGETAEEIADAAGIGVERVRWFEGPVLAERAYIADQAQAASVRRAGDSGPGPRLGDIVPARLTGSGADPDDAQWDARKRGDGNWQVTLSFPSAGRVHIAEWVFDPRRRHAMPDDDNAARLSLPESELPPEPVALPGEATVTSLAPRLGAAAGMGGGVGLRGPSGFAVGGSSAGVRSFRPERSVIPDRSLGADRTLAAERGPARPRPSQDQPVRHDQAVVRDVTPESAPYFAPEPAAYRDPVAQEPPAYRAPVSDPPAAPRPVGFDDAEPAVTFSDREPAALGDQLELAPPAVITTASTKEQPVAPQPESAVAAAPAEPARDAAAAAEAAAEAEAGPQPAADDQPVRPRSVSKKNAKGRRASVPSWDEIMLGSSRQRE